MLSLSELFTTKSLTFRSILQRDANSWVLSSNGSVRKSTLRLLDMTSCSINIFWHRITFTSEQWRITDAHCPHNILLQIVGLETLSDWANWSGKPLLILYSYLHIVNVTTLGVGRATARFGVDEILQFETYVEEDSVQLNAIALSTVTLTLVLLFQHNCICRHNCIYHMLIHEPDDGMCSSNGSTPTVFT